MAALIFKYPFYRLYWRHCWLHCLFYAWCLANHCNWLESLHLGICVSHWMTKMHYGVGDTINYLYCIGGWSVAAKARLSRVWVQSHMGKQDSLGTSCARGWLKPVDWATLVRLVWWDCHDVWVGCSPAAQVRIMSSFDMGDNTSQHWTDTNTVLYAG